MRVMFDTNIIISAIYNQEGKPFQAYLKASQPPHSIVLCDQIVDEVRKVFIRKFPHRIPWIEWFFTITLFELVAMPGMDKATIAEAAIRDETDRPILRAAIKANVDILITGDKDFLQSGIKNPRILTPAEFLAEN